MEVRSARHFGLGGLEVRWTVKVPKGAVVDLRTTNGKVQLTGLTGEVHARTVNGGVTGRGLAVQVLEASTVNGGVDVESPSHSAAMPGEPECVNGGVQLALPGDSRRASSPA